ncbi:MAG: hypothetical protein ACREDL_21925 [Bradyrhizobium sp.]
MSRTDFPEPSPAQAQLLMRVRRMMLIAGVTTALAIGAVLVAIGYRVSRGEGSSTASSAGRAATPDVTATLPRGARIMSTAAAGDRLLVTLDVAGHTEIRSFDAHSFKPTGRLTFATAP